MAEVVVYRGFSTRKERFEKFVFGSKSSSPVVLFEDEVCFREWVPCGGQGLIKDGVIMVAML